MREQAAKHILLVKPVRFFKNPETSVNNYFQSDIKSQCHLNGQEVTANHISELASQEFYAFVKMLRSARIFVTVWQSKIEDAPDSIFPNNWFISGVDKTINLMPIFAHNRRIERDENLINYFKHNLHYKEVYDYSFYEKLERYFEGTGSVVFHHPSKTAYVSLSIRADKVASAEILKSLNYKPIFFESKQTTQNKRLPIYHTNVVLSIGEKFAVICLDSIDKERDRKIIKQSFKDNNLDIIEISEKQMENFCGNILQVKNSRGELKIVMSDRARNAFTTEQRAKLEKHGELISSSLQVIETLGGGGARCMMAELF